jgi:hypothetical protein
MNDETRTMCGVRGAAGPWPLWLFMACLCVTLGPEAHAQVHEKTLTAHRIIEPIRMDGELAESEWDLAQPVSDFVQADPEEGSPPSERTSVRVLFDDDNLYFGIYCYDSNPDGIIVNDLKRDFDTFEGDVFGISLDPFHDHRNAFSFFTNAAAAKQDSQGFQDGRVIDTQWDGIWHSAAQRRSDGWSAEVIIPFKTLGFRTRAEATLGVNFKRRIRRKNENIYWSLVPRRFNILHVSLAGVVHGLEEVSGGHNLRVKPFMTTRLDQQRASSASTRDLDAELGLDVKYRLTPGVTLDLTYNTDFSQVEVDAEQINLTRFSLFFPEKREFFLENAGMFRLGDVGTERGASRSEDTQLFYSRRIGLSDTGQPLPLLGGARLSGRAGRFVLGFLNIQQEASGATPSNNFTVARLSRDFLTNSDFGAIFVNRQGGTSGDYNRAYGLDLNLQLLQKFSVNTFMAATDTPGLEGENLHTKISTKWDNGLWSTQLLVADIGENFRPEVGTVQRTDVRNYQFNFNWYLRPGGNNYFRELMPNMNVKYYEDHDFGLVSRDTQFEPVYIVFRDGATASFSINPQFDRLVEPFRIRPGIFVPVGDYTFNEYRLAYSSDRSQLFSGSIRYVWGPFYDGDKRTASATARLLVKPHLSASLSYSHNQVDVKAGGFRADLYSLRVGYSFNPVAFADAFIQYNTDTGKIVTNLRFNLIHRPLSDISVVFTEDRAAGTSPDAVRALIFKYTHLVQF